MFGYSGRMLHIDLAKQKFSIENYDEQVAKKYLGANGFAAKILYERLKPGIDPFSPDNIVVFGVGPITDTLVPSTSRAYVATKSPLNGLFFDSTFGGRFAITQKRTGFEIISISGKASSPIYLFIDENGVQFKSAESLWGKMTRDTVKTLQDVEGEETDSVAIGPAGEKMVLFACLSHYWRGREGISGRGGIGAVLGSKNVKAVVVKGDQKTQVADNVSLPVVASGGAGKMQDFSDAVTQGKASILLAASVFHFRILSIRQVKEYLREQGIDVIL